MNDVFSMRGSCKRMVLHGLLLVLRIGAVWRVVCPVLRRYHYGFRAILYHFAFGGGFYSFCPRLP